MRVMPRRVPTVVAMTAAVLTGLPAHTAAQSLRAELYVGGLTRPVGFVPDPSNSSIHYVVEQGGLIRIVQNGTLRAAPFLDLSAAVLAGGERGLLGLAFPPDYAASGRFYVNFTRAGDGHTVVARFRRSAADPLVADPASRFDLRWSTGLRYVVQPASNHNGGHMAFGPDGYLYVGLGDGGGSGDPQNNAQTPGTLLGKMLRIDVGVPDSDPEGFDVPADNPFMDGVPVAARPEIWAFGLRNPWRWSFDDPARGGTGALIIADVGQSGWEEIDYEPRNRGGRNYGWRLREGRHPFSAGTPAYEPLTDPVFELDRTRSTSVTGGFVYRGALLGSAHRGRYFFADFYGRVYSIALTVDPATGEAVASDFRDHSGELGAIGNISAFGQDSGGELYVVSWSTGEVHRVQSSLQPPPAPGPISPAGTIGTTSPVYRWSAAEAAEWYYLWVSDEAGVRLRTWITATAAGCASGTGSCAVSPATPVAAGRSTWWVRGWNAAGYGAWSAGLTFTTTAPGAATLISPAGTIGTSWPTYVWNAVPLATWYQLWVTDAARRVSRWWYRAEQAGCGAGTDTCSATSPVQVPLGETYWWIQTWNNVGYGPWSAAGRFTIAPPGAATLLSPEGSIATATPVFVWLAVERATYYYLWVADAAGTPRLQRWYAAAAAGCSGGTGVCTVEPGTTLPAGAGTWWIQAWNPAGYGPWSAGTAFSIGDR